MDALKKNTPLVAPGIRVGVVQVDPFAEVIYAGPTLARYTIAANTPALLTANAHTLLMVVALATEVPVQVTPSLEVVTIGYESGEGPLPIAK
jgi:hypothetical protein